MSLNLRLGPRNGKDPARGLHEGGTWVLDTSGLKERYATFSSEDQVVLVAELSDNADVVIETGGEVKVVLRGRLMAADGPARLKLWGLAASRGSKPVPALADPLAARRVCACGCGVGIPRSAQFAAGHDKKAIHERISRRWGTLAEFVRWFDANESTAADPIAGGGG
ncbi:MAG: hypothetical protein ACRDZ8_07855 [Acidimicrobiales bacterium]